MEYIISHQEVVDNGDTIGTPCIICGEPVLFSHDEFKRFERGLHVNTKICDKCKAAIMWTRSAMTE